MCGITGIVNMSADVPIDADMLAKMNDLLSHRGPDGSGFHVDNGVGFGHRRLSIIDLAGGKQPLYNEDQSVVVTFNGEIYNYRDLEKELLATGHTFRTRCDTEVIVHAWEQYHTACVDRFNGMFAFAIWDANRQEVFIARDRLGVKPVYYAETAQGQLIFASELKALLPFPNLNLELDPQALEDYFTFGYVPEPKSIYTNIKKLPPGHTLRWRRGEKRPTIECYWDVPLYESSDDISFSQACNKVAAGLKAATSRRLIADVPLGAFLSGGIDSSGVVAMMSEINPNPVLTCSIGFDEKKYDESQYAQMVAEVFQTKHHSHTVQTSAYDLIDKLVGLYDEPYADSSAIPTYRVCEMARKHVTVALSGDAGDECFIGYRRYNLFAMEERIRRLFPETLRRRVFTPLGRYYPKLDWAPRFIRGKTTFQALARESADAYLHGVSICSDEMKKSLFSKKQTSSLQGYNSRQVFDNHLAGKEFEDPLRMIQYLDYKTYLPGDILTKVDRASMGVSLEVRSPFLDYQYIEDMTRLPTKHKLVGGVGKYVLKKSLEKRLPHEVLYRKKMGFAVPLDIWFRDSLRERLTNTLSGERLRDCGIFDSDYLTTLLDEHTSGRRDHAGPLWSLLMFDGFLKHSA